MRPGMMEKDRVEAFSDGVLAIIITVMVLELRTPAGDNFAALRELLPVFLAYVMSFVYVGIYWNNHHHLLHAARGVDGAVMWANLHLLFWLSLVPFATRWLGEHPEPAPTALYGLLLLAAALSYSLLQYALTRHEPRTSAMVRALGRDLKGKVSIVLYAAAIGLGFWRPWIAWVLYATVALIWLVPDRRLATHMATPE